MDLSTYQHRISILFLFIFLFLLYIPTQVCIVSRRWGQPASPDCTRLVVWRVSWEIARLRPRRGDWHQDSQKRGLTWLVDAGHLWIWGLVLWIWGLIYWWCHVGQPFLPRLRLEEPNRGTAVAVNLGCLIYRIPAKMLHPPCFKLKTPVYLNLITFNTM